MQVIGKKGRKQPEDPEKKPAEGLSLFRPYAKAAAGCHERKEASGRVEDSWKLPCNSPNN